MNAPDYLTRLQAINEMKASLDGTAQTAKTNLRGLCSPHQARFQQPTTPAPIVSPRDTAADFDREWFEERAAIYEFEAGFPRHEAERLARKEIMQWTKMN